MAWIDGVDRSRIPETLYSRYRSPDRRLYNYAQAMELGRKLGDKLGTRILWWTYTAECPVLKTNSLDPQLRNRLVEEIPF